MSSSAALPLPLPEELSANTVAIVSHVPERLGTIRRAEFQHALVQAAAADRRPAPRPGGNGYEKLKRTAIGELFDTIWIEGQAREMGIGVTPRQVSRELAVLKREAFRSEAAYHRFLRQAHYTRRDVRERVAVQMFSLRITERVLEGSTSKAERQKVLTRFVAEYEEQWSARTVCALGYVTDRCSNSLSAKRSYFGDEPLRLLGRRG